MTTVEIVFDNIIQILKIQRHISLMQVFKMCQGNLTIFEGVRKSIEERKEIFSDDFSYYTPLSWPPPLHWPVAIDAAFIATTNEDRVNRAWHIIDLYFGPKPTERKVLDYGCGDGVLVSELGKIGCPAVGYDIDDKNFPAKGEGAYFTKDWNEVVSNGPYDDVVIFDVIDHLVDEDPVDVLKKVQKVLKKGGKVHVRFHPWTSRHATHLYKTLNRAYIHLMYSDEYLKSKGYVGEPSIKQTNPVLAYRSWIEKAGLSVLNEDAIREQVPSIFYHDKAMWQAIAANWKNCTDVVVNSGIKTPYNCGNFITKYDAWYEEPRPTMVGRFTPNTFGLYDMHGNVWEWCEDTVGPYSDSRTAVVDPVNEVGINRVIRGGGCIDTAENLRSACRLHSMAPDWRNLDVGVRFVLTVKNGTSSEECIENALGMKFMRIPEGTFSMGSPDWEFGRREEEREHDVKLTKPFYMSQFQLTQEQYEMVMKSNPVKDHNDYDPRHAYLPDHLCAVGPTHPVTFVSWVDAQEFAERMTLKDRYHYRLPTEAEWEYACRGVAGNATNIGQIMQIEFVDYTLEVAK